MGRPVVPYLLAELKNRRGYWFAALHEITGIRPFDAHEAGNSKRMTEAWLNWGRMNTDSILKTRSCDCHFLKLTSLNSRRLDMRRPAKKRGFLGSPGAYNCIAWAAGDTRWWWWPDPNSYWPPGPSSEMKQWGASFEHFAGWAIAPVSRLADNSGSKRSLYTQYTGRRCQRHFPQIGVERTTGFRLTWHVSCQMELGRANAVRVRTLRISPWTHLNVTATSVFTWGFIQFTHMGARQ